MTDSLNYGPCCACGREDVPTPNILMLPKHAPVPGTGWGCTVCNLPFDGALAVVCSVCFAAHAPVRFAVSGFLATPEFQRVPVEALAGPFQHDAEAHAYDNERREHAARYEWPLRIN